eukprot:COSAG04_NODE_23064_length_344_cov_1.061224_1_plen_36_part_10
MFASIKKHVKDSVSSGAPPCLADCAGRSGLRAPRTL